MKALFVPLLAFRLGISILLIAFSTAASAQTATPTPPPDPLAGIPVQVLDQQQVDMGDHTVTLNRIAPPPLAPPPPPSTLPSPSAPPGVEKPCKVVSLSLDQQDQRFTEVRDYGASRPELHAHLNVDFRLFGGVSQLETSDAFYLYMLAFDFDSTDASLPDPTLSLPDHASYAVTAGSAADYTDALGGLDALCAYFDANRSQLITDYQKRRADAQAHRNQPPTPTPTPRDTVINYWPVKSAVYPTAH